MNISTFRRIFFLSTLLLTQLLPANRMAAQGFLKSWPVNSNIWSSFPSTVDVIPDGYEVSGFQYLSSSTEWGAFSLKTNQDGNMVAFHQDSLTLIGIKSLFTLGSGRFIIIDTIRHAPDNTSIYIKKFDAYGATAWQDTMPQVFPNASNRHITIIPNIEGDYFLVGQNNSTHQVFIQKLQGSTGAVLHTEMLPPPPATTNNQSRYNQIACPDGGVLFVLYTGFTVAQSQATFLRIHPDGSVQPHFSFPTASYLRYGHNGDLYCAEYGNNPNLPGIDCELTKYSPAGNILWKRSICQWVQNGNFQVDAIIVTNDDGLLVCGGDFNATPSNPLGQSAIVRLDAAGNLMWKKNYYGVGKLAFDDGVALPEGDFIISGSNLPDLQLTLIKMDSLGNIFPNKLSGRVVSETADDCIAATDESGLASATVRALINGTEYFAQTDISGAYEFSNLPAGPYPVNLSVVPGLLQLPCPPVSLNFPDTSGITLNADLAVKVFEGCPTLSVHLENGPWILVDYPCSKILFYAQCINWGAVAAQNAYVDLTLPTGMTVKSVSYPYTVTGQNVHIEVGDIEPADFKEITIVTTIGCDSTAIQPAYCLEAHIFPDTICDLPSNWSGANIVANALCQGDSIRFTLTNEGVGATTAPLEYVIIDDDVVMMQGNIPSGFMPGEETGQTVFADGSTFRVLSEQEPNSPSSGKPSLASAGCNASVNEFLLQFANQSGSLFSDTYCFEIPEEETSALRLAYPKGVYSEHFIEPGSPLQYTIHFRNTNNSGTVETVVLRDTLSPWINPFSLQFGSSSHPFTWTLQGTNELVITFHSINLPNSTTSPQGSKGFINILAEMEANSPPGSVIKGRTGVYFDQQPKITTNSTIQTIDTNFLKEISISVHSMADESRTLFIYPSPASSLVTIVLEGGEPEEGSRMVLSDATGRTVLQKDFSEGIISLRRDALPAGLYFVKIIEDEKIVGNGKLILK